MFQAQPISRHELVRTAMTATLDALRPARRRKPTRTPRLDLRSNTTLPSFLPPPFPSLPPLFPSSALASPSISIEWIGHATMLLNIAGKWVLTDPVLSERVGIDICGKIIGIERYTKPARTLEDLPRPDIILLSHAHLDHTDIPTLRRFASRYSEEIHIVTAKNTRDVLDNLAWKSVTELDWEEELWLEGIKICGLETRHNGWRLPWERDRAGGYTDSGRSYNGYLLAGGGKTVVFGGDTAYTPHFSSLRNEGVDVAIMPIGAYHGYESLHCTPEQALQMASEMRAEYFIPMHCSTFDQSDEEPHEPLQRLFGAAHRHESKIALNRIGECFIV